MPVIRYLAYSGVGICAALLTACALPPELSGTGKSSGQTTSADQGLIDVYVPGAVRTYYDHPDKKLNPMLNPKTPPPAFNESSAMANQCAPHSLDYAMYMNEAPLVDQALFAKTMQAGRDTAQARQVWQFNQQRLQAQLQVVSGPRSRRGSEPVQARPTGQPAGRSTGRAGGILSELLPGLIPNQAQQRAMPAPRNPFSEQQEQLQHNQEVLAAQDAQLKAQSQQYAQTLVSIYAEAFTRLTKTPTERISLARFNAFEKFRARQVELCIGTRGELTSETQARLQQLNARILPIAQTVVAGSRREVMQALNEASSSFAFQQEWTQQFGTPWLQNVASKDVELSKAATARSNALLAKEARERQEAQRRAEQEAARQAAAVRKKYLDNAARNLAPSSQEVTVLATTYLMNNTAARKGAGAFGPLDRTGEGSFTDSRDYPIFGRLVTGTTNVIVNSVRCQPKGQRQSCQVSVTVESLARDLLLGMLPSYKDTSETRAEFKWTAAGLESMDLKASVGSLYWSKGSGGGGSSYSSSGRPGADMDELNANRAQFIETQRNEAAQAGRPYMGESNQNLRREYGMQ